MSEQKNTILVIEDNEATRLLLDSILTKSSYHVIAKSDCIQALTWLKNGNLPSIILLDIHMPLLNGFDFLTYLKNSGFFQHIPVLVVSSMEDDDDYKILQTGASDIIRKPYNPTILRNTIKKLLSPKALLTTVR